MAKDIFTIITIGTKAGKNRKASRNVVREVAPAPAPEVAMDNVIEHRGGRGDYARAHDAKRSSWSPSVGGPGYVNDPTDEDDLGIQSRSDLWRVWGPANEVKKLES